MAEESPKRSDSRAYLLRVFALALPCAGIIFGCLLAFTTGSYVIGDTFDPIRGPDDYYEVNWWFVTIGAIVVIISVVASWFLVRTSYKLDARFSSTQGKIWREKVDDNKPH